MDPISKRFSIQVSSELAASIQVTARSNAKIEFCLFIVCSH